MANKGAKKKPLRPDEVVKVPRSKKKKAPRKQSRKKVGLNWWEKGSDL